MKVKNLRSNLSGLGKKAAAVVTTAMVAAPAFAGELGEAATEAMDKSELYIIGAAVMTLCGVVAIIRSSRRASGG